jgi:hypothetical protein
MTRDYFARRPWEQNRLDHRQWVEERRGKRAG